MSGQFEKWGSLEIRAPMGRGRFGDRFLAFDTVLRREVAVEFTPPEQPGDQSLLERVRHFARLRHPNIVAVHGVEVRDDRLGAWFELPRGASLALHFAERGPIEDREVVSIGVALCRALREIHGAGLVHGALGLESAVLEPDGRVVLIDIGPGGIDERIHSGTAESREFERRDLSHLAAVLLALADPSPRDRRLLSVLHDASESHLPDVQVEDGGKTRGLRELSALSLATRLAAAVGAVLPSDLLETRALPLNLPQEATSFVGRDRERAELRNLVFQHALCTIRGPGGSGKSRLAAEVSRDLRAAFTTALGWADLTEVSSGGSIAEEILESLGIRSEPPRADEDVLARRIGRSEALIVLDNCEHLRSECARLASLLLSRCPGLRILATSRQRLDVEGESVLALPPLSLPDGERSSTAEVLQSDALRLFVARAQSSRPDLTWGEDAVQHALRICRLVDGLPLAIELAAARVRSLSLGQISDRLQENLDILRASGHRPSRVATIRASIEWSYQLLDPEEQTLFRRLGVLHSPWTEDSVRVITSDVPGGDTIGERSVSTLLASLLDKSLVSGVDLPGGSRYRHLDMILRFARASLAATSELAGLKRRHFDYYAALAEDLGTRLHGPDFESCLKTMRDAMPNVRAAVAYSLTPAVEPYTAFRMAVYVGRVLGPLGRYAEEWKMSTAVLGKSAVPSNARGALLVNNAESSLVHGEVEMAERAATEAVDTFRTMQLPLGVAMATLALSSVALARGDNERARKLAEEGLQIRHDGGDKVGEASCTSYLGVVAARAGRYEEAADWYQRALTLAESIGEQHIVLRARSNLAAAYRDLGRLEDAHEQSVQVLGALEQSAAGEEIAGASCVHGGILRRMGQFEEARLSLTRALELHAADRQQRSVFEILLELALLEHGSHDPGEAALLLGAAESLEDASTESALRHTVPWLWAETDAMTADLRTTLGEAQWATQRAIGRRLTVEQVVVRVRQRYGRSIS